MPRSLDDGLRWTVIGTELIEGAVSALTTADLREASSLPGWSRAHVVAHVAANARAVGNLVHWAATGVETPMYASATQRAEGIERGSQLPATELAAELASTAATLATALAELRPDQWSNPVVTAQGRTVPVSEVPWMRAREVCVHAVDVGAGVGFADLPDDFLAALEHEITDRRGDVPSVEGPLSERVAWLTGRPHALRGAPALGPWL